MVKNPPTNAGNSRDVGDVGSVPGLGRSPGGGNGNPFQYSCLENPMDRGAWRATVHGVAKSQTQLSNLTHSLSYILGVYDIPNWPLYILNLSIFDYFGPS